jgi:hypothetical protein
MRRRGKRGRDDSREQEKIAPMQNAMQMFMQSSVQYLVQNRLQNAVQLSVQKQGLITAEVKHKE